MSDETLIGYLLADLDQDPRRSFIQRPTGAVTTYEEGVCRLMAIADWLHGLGIERGEPVPCYLDDPVSTLFFTLACAAMGVVPVPLSPVFSVDYFIDGLVTRLGARHVFTSREHVSELLRSGRRVLCFGAAVGSRVSSFADDAAMNAAMNASQARDALAASAAALRADDVFMIQPTSGSTGVPKLVVRHHRAFTRYARFVGDAVRDGQRAPDRFLVAAALTHAFGLHMLATALWLGATLAIPSQVDTRISLAEVRALDPTVLPLLPRVQKVLHARAAASRGPMLGPSARVVCSAGGSPPRDILEAFQREGARVVEFYGSSEASLVAVTPREGWRPPYAGRVVPDAEARIAPDGELLVKSPGVTAGYVGDEAATRAAFSDGFYRTGDFAELSSDGFLRILGRKCDVFNTPEGSNIHPRRIEEMLERLGRVHQVVLVGDQRPFIIALIVVTPDALEGPSGAPSGLCRCLDRQRHPALYAELEAAIAEVNAGLERIEWVRAFALLAEPFPREVYAVVEAGKVRRDRRELTRAYAPLIDSLYGPATPARGRSTHAGAALTEERS